MWRWDVVTCEEFSFILVFFLCHFTRFCSLDLIKIIKAINHKMQTRFYPSVFWILLIDLKVCLYLKLTDSIIVCLQLHKAEIFCAQTVFSGFTRGKLRNWRKACQFSKRVVKFLTQWLIQSQVWWYCNYARTKHVQHAAAAGECKLTQLNVSRTPAEAHFNLM